MPEPDHPPSSERPRPAGKITDALPTPSPRPESPTVETERISPPARPSRGAASDSQSTSERSRGGGDDSRVGPRALPNLGEKIDEFRLVDSIGAGGMGAVFRAVDVGLDRQVALKILPPEQAVDPEVVRRYHQEGRAAARLDHENIARVYTIGDDGRYHYIAFEYIEGVTIRQQVARDGPLSVADAIHYTLQIAQALIHAAEREVVHRDIKPSNIILTPGGRAKLVDMGLARQFERGGEADLTQTGMTLGTFDYISPEQARDPRDVDIRGDLYSLGCTLFHMLSGRPPFPDGTVLQKLIQHREEAPPDIRQLNPKVPDALAAILVKLLVKDREHRYQTPEQLARDLGRVASRRTITLPSARSTPDWARHLFWGGPGLVFLVLLGGMIWWGDGPTRPNILRGNRHAYRAGPDNPTAPPFVPGPFLPRSPDLGTTPRKAEAIPPQPVAVRATDDLARILAEAPPKATILLVDRGPYNLPADRPIRLDHRDLTIRAEVGVRPLIRLARDFAPTAAVDRGASNPTAPAAATVDIRGGRVTFDGIDFIVDPAGFEAAFGGDRPSAYPGSRVLAAIAAEDAEVVIRRCSFRRASSTGSNPASSWKPAAIRFQGTSRTAAARGSGDAPVASLLVDASELDGLQVGLLVAGSVDVSLRDVAFGPALADGASIWADNPDGATTPAEFRLDHISGLLGAGPMFRFHGTTPRVIARHSVFGPIPLNGGAELAPTATLVAIDLADRLDWRGGDNLYARLGVYLRPAAGSGRALAPIRTFSTWGDEPTTYRESGSDASDGLVWERLPTTTAAPFAAESPRSFRLVLPRLVAHHPGARWGPTGPLPQPTWLAAAGVASPNRTIPLEASPAPGDRPSDLSAPNPAPVPGPPPSPRRSAPGVDAADEPVEEMPAGLTPMPMPVEPDRPAPAAPEPVVATPLRPPVVATPLRPPVVVDSAPIRSTAEFLAALGRDEPGAKLITLAADAVLDLPSGRIGGVAPWTIRAERGPTRPRVRFRADAAGSVETGGWSAWLLLRSGGLRLEGVDLILPPAGSSPPRAAFAVRSGVADLVLDDCTVTIEGDDARSAVVAVLPDGDPMVATNPFDHLFASPRRLEPAPAAPRIRFHDCLLRAAGDLIDVAPGRSVDLDLDNSVVATAGVLVHGHGREEGRSPGTLRVTCRRIATRSTGGLIHLETDRDRPSLPVAAIQATDTIFALANSATPLLRVDGQGELAAQRDRITWQARSVAYHRIDTYRRDGTTRPGVSPARLDRNGWESALPPGADEGAIRGDLAFLDEPGPAQPAWSIRADHLRLQPNSPAAVAAIGPDLLEIPAAPRATSGL